MQAIRATYQNGVFTPEQPIHLPEGTHVTLWVGPPESEVAHLRPEDREFLDDLVSQRAEVFRRLDDLGWYLRERDPAFLESIAQARRQITEGHTRSHSDLEKELGIE